MLDSMSTFQQVQSRPNRSYRLKKTLLFRGRPYPVDFIRLLNNSDFFLNKMNEYQNINVIELINEPIDISPESFEIFLDYIHDEINEEKINEQNVFQLQQLSKTYEVANLKKSIENFYTQHPDISILPALLNETTNEDIERRISSHFFDFINTDQLLSMPIPILHRILNSYDFQINNLNENDQKPIIDFLLKYLRKNGKPASVLFSNIDIERSRIDLISILLNQYSDVFDFNMINPKMGVKTIRDLLEENAKYKIETDKKIQEMSKMISNLTDLLNEKISNQQIYEKKFQEIESQLTLKQDKNQTDIDQRIKNVENQINQQNQINQRIDKIESQISNLESLISSVNSNQNQIKEIKKQLSTPSVECPNGIFKYLYDEYKTNPTNNGIVEISGNSGGSHSNNIHHLIESNWSGDWGSEYVENSYIQINFKKYFVKISKYHIHIGNKSNGAYFKSWILKGTTEDNDEITLDEVNNMSQITSNNLRITQLIRSNEYLKSIKLIMRGKNSCDNYCMVVRNIELFGSIK